MSPDRTSPGPSRISIASLRVTNAARDRAKGQLPRHRATGCPAGVRVDAESLAGLRAAAENASLVDAALGPAARPAQVRDVEPMLWCELEAGHDGPHVSRCRPTHDDDSWARWAEPDLLRLAWCPADNGLRREQLGWAACTLPAQHTGGHSFQYR